MQLLQCWKTRMYRVYNWLDEWRIPIIYLDSKRIIWIIWGAWLCLELCIWMQEIARYAYTIFHYIPTYEEKYVFIYIYMYRYIPICFLHLSFASPMPPSRKKSGITDDTHVCIPNIQYIYYILYILILQYCMFFFRIFFTFVHILSQSHMAMANPIVSKKLCNR